MPLLQLNIKLFPYIFIIGISLLPMLGEIGLPMIANTYTLWIADVVILFYTLKCYKITFHNINSNTHNYIIIKLYLLWAFVCIIRGGFIAENYWEYKSLVSSTFCLLLPTFVFIFQSPIMIQKTLCVWLKYAFPLFILIGMWVIPIDGYHFFISPILLIGCFLPVLPKKWMITVGLFLLIMLLGELGARAQMMKSAAVLGLSICLYFYKIIPLLWLKIAHWLFYILPILLLTLGITGVYNIFETNSKKNKGKFTSVKKVDGKKIIEDASADTRTFIYQEVITSAINHNYVIWGRTPARGNDSEAFGAFTAEELKTGKYERNMNEVCHPNVFTWTGLLGMIPWCLIYLRASYLALYRSKSIFLKLIGVFIAFRFFLGWIEDVNNFNISGIVVWMIIAMGYSEYFRVMTNLKFKNWLKNCLPF